VGTAVGCATGIAGVSLQGYQVAQANQQLPEQEEFLKLQKKIAQHQLRQYEDQEKAEKQQQREQNMYKTPTNIVTGMTTRSMAQGANLQHGISNASLISNTSLGPIQRGNITGTAVPLARNQLLSPYASSESIPMIDRRLQLNLTGSTTTLNSGSRAGSIRSFLGSTDSLDHAHPQFARRLQGTLAPSYGEQIELASLHPSQQFGSSSRLYGRPATTHSSYGSISSFSNFNDAGFRPFGHTLPPGTVTQRPSAQLLKTIQRIPERIRGLFPNNTAQRMRSLFAIRASANGESAPLLGGGGGGRMTSMGRFLNTHKRKLITAGAIVGGAAIVGATVGGILDAKRRKMMQPSETAGLFQQLTTGGTPASGAFGGGGGGGGGAGGFARFNQIQAAARHYVKRRKAKKGGKKHTTKKGAKKPTKKKNGVKHGRVGKRKGKKAAHSINKKRKKSKKGKKGLLI
jgi:hypothetical protein